LNNVWETGPGGSIITNIISWSTFSTNQANTLYKHKSTKVWVIFIF